MKALQSPVELEISSMNVIMQASLKEDNSIVVSFDETHGAIPLNASFLYQFEDTDVYDLYISSGDSDCTQNAVELMTVLTELAPLADMVFTKYKPVD